MVVHDLVVGNEKVFTLNNATMEGVAAVIDNSDHTVLIHNQADCVSFGHRNV